MILYLASAGKASAEPLDWVDFPGPMTLTYSSRYADPNPRFDDAIMSRKVLDLENDREIVLTFPPPDPARPDHRVIRTVAQLRSGAAREDLIELAKRGEKMAWTHYHLVYRDPSGQVMREAEYDLTEPALQSPPDLYQNYSVLFVLMGLPFRVGYTQKLELWSTPRVDIGVTVKVAAIEQVTVPAGTFECFRVEVAPLVDDYFGALVGRIVRPFVPPYQFWFETAGAHRPIKFETGVAATPNLDVPTVVRELVSVQTGEAGK